MKNNIIIIAFSVLLTILSTTTVNCEYYTSVADIEELLETESILITTLDDYINDMQIKLNKLRQYHDEYYKKHIASKQNTHQYLSNPINAYLIVKRLTTDWKNNEILINDLSNTIIEYPIIFSGNENNNQKVALQLPTDEDLNGAVAALIRLQDVYRLDTTSMANGELNGVQYRTSLSVDDCFELGKHLFGNSDYYHTILWMYEAKTRLHLHEQQQTEQSKQLSTKKNKPESSVNICNKDCSKTTAPLTFTKSIINTTYVDILEYLAYSVYMEGNLAVAIDLTKELLELEPEHVRAKDNLVLYEYELKELNQVYDGEIKIQQQRRQGEDDQIVEVEFKDEKKNAIDFFFNEEPITIREKRRPDYNTVPDHEVYEKLCRNEIQPSPKVLSKLKCRYRTKRAKFTWIAPFKEEEMSLEPLIDLYHQVLSDDEIYTIKQLAQPWYTCETVSKETIGEGMVTQTRVCKSAWIKPNEHEHIINVEQRIEDLTELTQTTAEELQVANYGIGGHFSPHIDFAEKDEDFLDLYNNGNRIATLLFYMSDVIQGGATVFPSIKTALWPVKGSAAFWYNLHPSGEGDRLTIHAACPVLSGSKWVATKWIHEYGQEFLRPCRLEPDPLEPDL